jgi:hypothetical protein
MDMKSTIGHLYGYLELGILIITQDMRGMTSV